MSDSLPRRLVAVVKQQPGARVLAIDVGERRLGFALSDETGMLASELAVISRRTPEEDAAHLRAIVAAHGVGTIVVGMPRSMGGELGWQARRTRDWVDRMRETVPVPIETLDERLTTVEAERGMRQAGVSSRDRKQRIDMAAAVVLLQAALDRRHAQRTRRRA